MSSKTFAKDAQLRETLIPADKQGTKQAPKQTTSWWRSTSAGALVAATPNQPKMERIGGEVVFDQFTDRRPLNYKYVVETTQTGSKSDQVEGGKHHQYLKKEKSVKAEEKKRMQIVFSMQPRTWAVTRDQKYAYVYVPDANAIEIVKIPSFESLATQIRYELPDSSTGIKLLIIDDFNNQFEEQKKDDKHYHRLYIVDLTNRFFVMEVECPDLETAAAAEEREWLQFPQLPIYQIPESTSSLRQTENFIRQADNFSSKEYFSIHVNQVSRELIFIFIDTDNNIKVTLSSNITGNIEKLKNNEDELFMNAQLTSINSGSSRTTSFWREPFVLRMSDINYSQASLRFYDFDGNIYLKIEQGVFVINKESGKTWDPLNAKLNRKEGFTRVKEFIVQENLVIVQHTDNTVKMYAKQFGQYQYSLELVKQVSLRNTEDEIGLKIFKFHAGQLFLKNDQEQRIIVISLDQGEEAAEIKQEILWSYEGFQNSTERNSAPFFALGEIQFDYTHLIHLMCADGRVMQLNAYKSEMILECRWPMIRKKKKHQYFLISNGLLYQDGENDGRLVTFQKSGGIQQKDIAPEKYGSDSCKIYMKNFFFLEGLNKIMLISDTNECSSPKTKFFIVSLDGQEFREIRGLEQKNDVIFVGILPSQDPNLFFLFVIKSKKHVFCYQLARKDNGDFESYHNEFVDIISSEDQFNKEDVYLMNPDSEAEVASVIVKKNIRVQDKTSSQYSFYRVTIKDIQEKIGKIAKSRNVNEKNAKVDNIVKRVNQTPRDIGLTFISLHGQQAFFVNKEKRLKVFLFNKEEAGQNQEVLYEFKLSLENYQILDGFAKQQVQRRIQNDREQNELNESLLHNEKYLIFQKDNTVYVFDCEVKVDEKDKQRELKLLCQINNVPPEASFKYDVLNGVKRYYIVMQSAFDGYLDIKEFMIFKENESEASNQFSAKIPEDLKLDIDQCVVYDLASPRCEVFDTIDKKLLKFWTNMAPRSILEKKRLNYGDKDAVGIFVDDSSRFDECLYFDTLHGNSIFHYIIEKQQIFGAIILKILQLNTDQIPILMFEDRNQKTCLDLLVEKRQQKSLQQILNMTIYHEEAAPFYNKHIDRHLISMIEMNLNLSDLFNSEILYHQLSTFDTLSTNKEMELWPNDSESLRQILEGRDGVASARQLELLSGGKKSKIKAVAGPKDGSIQEAKVAVEYKIINMKQTLQKKPSKDENGSPTLIEQLLNYQGDTIYEFECIQKIIQYKWETFTRDFYTGQFRKFICILFCFATSLFLSTLLLSDQAFKKDEPDMYELYKNVDMGLNIICGIFSIFIIYDEIQSMKGEVLQYFLDPQNYVDLPLFLLLLSQAVLKGVLEDPSLTSHDAFKVMKIAMIFLSFLKLNFYLQMYDSFSFLVNMLIQVFMDLSYFLAFFGMVVSTFSMLILVMMPTVKDNYEGTGLFAYLVMAFRSSLGDFSLDEYKAMSITDAQGNQTSAVYPMQWLVWVVWLVIIVVGNVVFMNFIIAVVNESYINSMSMQKAQSFRLKVPLINEQEKKIINENISKTKDFPNYIIVKTPANLISEDPGEEQSRQFKDFQSSLKKLQSVQADQNVKLQQIADAVSSFDVKFSQTMLPPASLDSGFSSAGGPIPSSSQLQQKGYQGKQDEPANVPFNGQNNLSKPIRGAVKRV